MNRYEHLQITPFQGETPRRTRSGGGGYTIPEGRQKSDYFQNTVQRIEQVVISYASLKKKFSGIVTPSLIFELEVNQSVDFAIIDKQLASMDIHILSVAENKKGYWVVFSDDETLDKFKQKLATYGSPDGPKYDFFNAFGELRDIPKDEKIGVNLKNKPLTENADFIDIELWRLNDERKIISFTEQLNRAFPDKSKFHITDKLITKSFALFRVKITKSVFDEIIEFKEIVRADRPFTPQFNPFDVKNIDVSEIAVNPPDENAAGTLIVDSGILSNHPFLEQCVGDEQNFQTGEPETHDTVGHGTAVAGCAAYGDIEKALAEKVLNPSNWIFSAKVMYAETDFRGNKKAIYNPEKLFENQLKDAIEYFLSNSDYQIRVVNISFGNSSEIWHKDCDRQFPLAALIDELAYTFPNVVFVVSAGNKRPQDIFDTIAEIKDNYPAYLQHNPEFKIINPATAALALTVGSIVQPIKAQVKHYGAETIKTPIANENQPSPFTRSGPGINRMVKPELVEYGGNLILYENYGRIREDIDGKIAVLNNQTTNDLVRSDYGTSYGTSFSAPKIAHIAGQIANKYPQRSANFIKNLLLQGACYPPVPKNEMGLFSQDTAYPVMSADDFDFAVCGYGLPTFERAVNSFDNRVVLFDEGKIQLNKVKVYSLQLPDIFFSEKGRKRIIVTLSFTPETRATRGDSYLGNRMEFHLFHSVNPQILVEKYAAVDDTNAEEVLAQIKNFELTLRGAHSQNAGCHQKAWIEFKRKRPSSPVSLVLINRNKWLSDENTQTDYCLSVTFEHEKDIDLYTQLRATIQTRARV